jgi:hypothetical protein
MPSALLIPTHEVEASRAVANIDCAATVKALVSRRGLLLR